MHCLYSGRNGKQKSLPSLQEAAQPGLGWCSLYDRRVSCPRRCNLAAGVGATGFLKLAQSWLKRGVFPFLPNSSGERAPFPQQCQAWKTPVGRGHPPRRAGTRPCGSFSPARAARQPAAGGRVLGGAGRVRAEAAPGLRTGSSGRRCGGRRRAGGGQRAAGREPGRGGGAGGGGAVCVCLGRAGAARGGAVARSRQKPRSGPHAASAGFATSRGRRRGGTPRGGRRGGGSRGRGRREAAGGGRGGAALPSAGSAPRLVGAVGAGGAARPGPSR